MIFMHLMGQLWVMTRLHGQTYYVGKEKERKKKDL